ncbi:MAG: hypothetical protein K2J77_02845 [Oscillospiraceae bacterium]|nr:hypothetical protein [Oscillospiraceae bacterium]
MTSEITNPNTNQNIGENGAEENLTAPTEPNKPEAGEVKPAKPAEPISGIPEGEESPEAAADDAELLKRIEELQAALLKEQIKVKLLVIGILPEKLEDAAAMAYGLFLAGRTADAAAEEIAAAYPHLKAIRTELPQFSAESAGSKDGFSAIRRIFSAR